MNIIGYQRLNMPPGSLDGKSVTEIFGEKMGTELLQRHRAALSHSEPVDFEHYVTLPTGTQWFFSVGTRFCNDSGKIMGVEVVSYNITERKQTELMLLKRIEELEAARK